MEKKTIKSKLTWFQFCNDALHFDIDDVKNIVNLEDIECIKVSSDIHIQLDVVRTRTRLKILKCENTNAENYYVSEMEYSEYNNRNCLELKVRNKRKRLIDYQYIRNIDTICVYTKYEDYILTAQLEKEKEDDYPYKTTRIQY